MMPTCRTVRGLALAAALACCGSGCAAEKSAVEPPVEGESTWTSDGASRDEFGISQGPVDVENRYRSVVSIRNGMSTCSGVLVAPLLVLSAAHCFCQPRSSRDTILDGSSCAREVAVLSYFYERSGNGWMPSKDVTLGKVAIHPAFRSEIARSGRRAVIKSKVADLAVVSLERALRNTAAETRLGSEEVLLREELIMAGYGATAPDGTDKNIRRFGGNVVSELRLSDDRKGQEIRFRFPGAHTHPGDSGGPCFREKGTERWLVGVNGGYVSQGTTESWFTSTFSYRDWIEGQMEEARKMESR
jgi:hypothetical protein